MPHVGPFIAQTSARCFDVAKKTLLSENAYDILTCAGPKILPKKMQKWEHGPGGEPFPAAWALKIDGLKGFRPEERLHRTRGRDRPGALFACTLGQIMQHTRN